MGVLTFRGVANTSLPGVYVARMPSHKKASMRFAEYYVKGRDGALHVDEGLANFDIMAVLVLVNAAANARQLVNAWADGTGKLITDDNPTIAYLASVKQEIQWGRAKGYTIQPKAFDATKAYSKGDYVTYSTKVYEFTANHAAGAWNSGQVIERQFPVNGFYDTATIIFSCQPYMVEAVDSTITLTSTSLISNPGSAESYPMIKVNGSGDAAFSVNGNEITIDDMTANVPVYIDSETGYVYTASGATAMTGDFPVFEMGENTVTITSGITSLEITPRWRWI